MRLSENIMWVLLAMLAIAHIWHGSWVGFLGVMAGSAIAALALYFFPPTPKWIDKDHEQSN